MSEKEAANQIGSKTKRFVDKAEDLAGRLGEWVAEFVGEHPWILLILLIVLIVALIISSFASSGGLLMSSLGHSTVESSFTPKKRFTESSLLSAMERAGADETPDEAERKGLGTPATRAGIIEKLVRIGFLERKGDKKTKYLVPTHKGIALITVMPEAIQSPTMTAEWEQKLIEVEKQNFEAEEFMTEIQ